MPFFKKKSLGQTLSLLELKENLQINFEPENAKPTSHYKSFYIETEKGGKPMRFGYINDFYGTGEPGIMVHGCRSGKIAIVSEGIREVGGGVRGTSYTPKEFYHYLISRHSLDLAKDKRPLHFVGCYSGGAKEGSDKLSTVQQLANITQRKIWAYGGYERVRGPEEGLANIIDSRGGIKNVKYNVLKPKLIEPHPPEFIKVKTKSSSRC